MHFQWIPCHRKKNRSIKIGSYTLPLCARCSGVLLGYLFLPLFFVFSSILKIVIIPILILPLLIDGFTQKWQWRESNNFLRLTTGILFGVGQCVLIVITVKFIIKLLI